MPEVSHSSSYEAVLAHHLHYYSRVTCAVAMLLIVAGVGLDAAFYPEQQEAFLYARLLVASLIGVTLLSYSSQFGASHIRYLTYFWTSLPQLMIAWMIYRTDGEASIYFVGLTFAIAGIGVYLPLSMREALSFSAFTIVVYVLACVLRPMGVERWTQLFGQLIFIIFYAVIAISISIYGSRSRRQNFEQNLKIRQQQDALQDSHTALTQMKGQLLQREKMAAIGTLSAGLLHELNNPVNYSLMAINMGLMHPAVDADPMLKESLVDAREGMQRIQGIVSDLKTFAYQKPGADAQRPFLLAHAVRSAMRLSSHELEGIEIVLDLPDDSHALGDEPAIIGVLINLFSNAANALQTARRPQPRIDLRVLQRDGRLWLTLRDNGPGIEPAHIGRVFEPFFTTRDVGAGLGLGLSMSYGIVQRHGGTLTVASEPGAWTEFGFDLPRPA